jgi:hypothetical protein
VSKYAQTTDRLVDYHVYPSGKQVIKAFTANNFQFFDKNSQVITELSDASIEVINRVRITWRIQKNCQNNQMVTLSSDKTNTTIFPILAALPLVLRARRLLQPDLMLVACYLKKDALAYISGSRIAVLLQAVARAVPLNISKEEEQQYSTHSLQVWACVLLDEAGKCRKPPRYVLYKGTYAPYDGTYGAPDQGQTLDVRESQTAKSALRNDWPRIVPHHTLEVVLEVTLEHMCIGLRP